VGIFQGFSFPIYNTDNEELFFSDVVPRRWDGVSDITFSIWTALADAEDVGDGYQFQFSWERAPCGKPIPETIQDVEVETTILANKNEQYDEYCVRFTLDYNLHGAGNEIIPGDLLGGRLRRIASGGTEVDNEIIIFDWYVRYDRGFL